MSAVNPSGIFLENAPKKLWKIKNEAKISRYPVFIFKPDTDSGLLYGKRTS